MFKEIEVYKDYKAIARQHFSEGVKLVPKKGDYIKIKGMYTTYRVKLIEYNYADGVIEISVY